MSVISKAQFSSLHIKVPYNQALPLDHNHARAHGMPQGSVLGSIIFNTYISIEAIINKFGIQYQLYPDDTQLYILYGPASELSVQETSLKYVAWTLAIKS